MAFSKSFRASGIAEGSTLSFCGPLGTPWLTAAVRDATGPSPARNTARLPHPTLCACDDLTADARHRGSVPPKLGRNNQRLDTVVIAAPAICCAFWQYASRSFLPLGLNTIVSRNWPSATSTETEQPVVSPGLCQTMAGNPATCVGRWPSISKDLAKSSRLRVVTGVSPTDRSSVKSLPTQSFALSSAEPAVPGLNIVMLNCCCCCGVSV